MTLVVMKAKVPREQWEALIRAFDQVMENRPNAIVESILAQDLQDPILWRIITIWESLAALDAYSASMLASRRPGLPSHRRHDCCDGERGVWLCAG